MIRERISKLIDLKSIITILMVISLIVGFFIGKIEASELIPLVTMILTFYFTKKGSDNNA